MAGSRDDWNPWPPHRLIVLVVAAAALAAGALIGIAASVGVRKELTALAHPGWAWIAAAVGGELFAYLGYTLAYREVARADDGAELEVPKVAALVVSGFGVFVHGGGFALDRAALRRAGLTRREARRRVLGLGTLEYVVLAPVTMVAAVWVVLWHSTISHGLTLPWIIGVPAGAFLALSALRLRASIARWPLIGGSLGHSLEALRLVIGLLRSRAGVIALGGTTAYWAGDIFCLWATLHAFSAHTPPVAQLIVGYSTGYALTRRALPLGGAGVVEALLPFALGWLRIALGPALLAVFAYRLINLWLPLAPALAGLPTLRRLERAGRQHAGAAREPGRTAPSPSR